MDPIAFIRGVPDSFAVAMAADAPDPPLDAELARTQHGAYRAALEDGGYQVRVIPADEGQPDCSFVEDTVVILGGRALATRPGHPSRRGEVAAAAAAVGELLPIDHMQSPARLDGGDVFSAAGKLFVGLSSRTDRAGAAALAEWADPVPVVEVPVSGVLHLRSAANPVGDETLLVEPGRVDESRFAGLRIVPAPAGEPHGANVVRLADERLLASAAAPRAVEILREAGFEVGTVDTSEFMRADGGLTCLSVRFRGG
jgi:dimethylargininase